MSVHGTPFSPPNKSEIRPDAGHVDELRLAIMVEIFIYLHLPQAGWSGKLLERIFYQPAIRFARLAAQFDDVAYDEGFRSACSWILPRFIPPPNVVGAETIPQHGPLLIVANHPGTFDALAVAANLPRDDFKAIARGMPFLQSLPAVRQALIFSSRDVHVKMTAARAAMRHLQNGGALLVFPSGTLDPDPACLPGACEALETWSASLDILLRVPNTRVQAAVLGGFLAPENLHHPMARFRASNREKQIAAEIIQVLRQMLFGKVFPTIPQVYFTPPFSIQELAVSSSGSYLPGIQALTRQALTNLRQV